MKTALLLFGGAVGVSIISSVTSTILHAMGKGEQDALLTIISTLTMIVMLIVLISLVLANIWSVFGINTMPDIFGEFLNNAVFGDHFN